MRIRGFQGNLNARTEGRKNKQIAKPTYIYASTVLFTTELDFIEKRRELHEGIYGFHRQLLSFYILFFSIIMICSILATCPPFFKDFQPTENICIPIIITKSTQHHHRGITHHCLSKKCSSFSTSVSSQIVTVFNDPKINIFQPSNQSNILSNYNSEIHIFQMIQPQTHLFQQLHSGMTTLVEELARPHLKHHFTANSLEVQLALTDNYILLFDTYNPRTPTHFCPLDFQLKFEVIYHPHEATDSIGTPIAIKLQRQHCQQQLTFHAAHPTIAEEWTLSLEKKINQRNFHKLFKAKRKIGKGAFATVYLAERLRDHQMVAVKAFSKQKQYAGDKGKQSLENEIKLMRRITHPNLMKLEGVYETQNSIYVILQYLQGSQLNEMLKSGKQPTATQVREIIHNLLRGLSHLAQHRIIHRDLKPENIMFRKDNSCDLAICDFGLATSADQQNYLFVRCGTPGFVAPEIINIRDMTTKSDPISDVFSAGIIFHYLIFGCSIFEGKKYNEILNHNRSCDINLGKPMHEKISPLVMDLLAKMLEKEPRKRISAEQALCHPYFNHEMEVEKHEKMAFQELTNTPQHYTIKKAQETPTVGTKKTQMVTFGSRKAYLH